MFNFDQRIDRTDTFSFKWEKYKGKDILPMWVADTEFVIAPAIQNALTQQVAHGVLGYHLPMQYTPANEALVNWCARRYSWSIRARDIVWTPGVCPGFNVAIRAFCQPGDHVLIQTPNYPPILGAPANHGCEAVTIDTVEADGDWMIDFDALETAAADPKAKLLIMCNPMNPVGSVLTQAHLARLADICERHDIILCSDEIHCDLILDDLPHLPAGAQDKLAARSITLMAPNKSFNIAGLGAAYAIIPDNQLRTRFSQAANGLVPWVNIMGLVATTAALTECDDWLAAQNVYLTHNRDHLVEAINAIDGLSAKKPPATFLLWVDASGLGVDDNQAWAESKGVGPSPGKDFGMPQNFRLNYGVSRSMLDEVIARLQA